MTEKMVKLTIDNQEVEVPMGSTVIQACEALDVEIPRFCYHERLAIAGNCRMCLVEMERAPKPIASCAMPVADGMVIRTDTPMVKKARQGVMEFLLINHPLDCPICDQGGECDLQDQAMAYGVGKSRYQENKRSVVDKNMGPLIKTQMTRCIHCTRCVRFATEIAGVPELGAIHRGEHMEITTYLEKSLASELSGNVIDLCPVGALTSKPYAFKARSWELKHTESIDVMDAVGSHIRVDHFGNEVMRILPRVAEHINEEWISDKTRFACDGLSKQRLDRPYIRKNGKLLAASWDEAFAAIATKFSGLKGEEIGALAGNLSDLESMMALQSLMDQKGSKNYDCRIDGASYDLQNPSSYLFNTTIASIEEADAVLIIGSNPRWEAPLINARLRKRYLQTGMPVAVIGADVDLTYKHKYLGNDPQILESILKGDHDFAKVLESAQKPMIILGHAALRRDDAPAILAAAQKMADQFGMIGEGWNGFNVLHHAASRVGGLALGFTAATTDEILQKAQSGKVKALYLLGVDEIAAEKFGEAFVIYQGHHGDRGAHRADVILPGAAYTEKDGTYINTEGRVQKAARAIFPLGEAKEDWRIIRALSEVLGKALPFDQPSDVKAALQKINPAFGQDGAMLARQWGSFGKAGNIKTDAFGHVIDNFYQTDAISRASPTMARCTAEFIERMKKAA